MRVKNAMLLLLPAALLYSPAAPAAPDTDEYIAKLDDTLVFMKSSGNLRVTLRPRLIEKSFAGHVGAGLARKESATRILEEWRPVEKKLRAEGFVFDITFELLNATLDSGIEVPFDVDLRRHVSLANNLGEKAALYKVAGDTVTALNFLYTEKKATLYFNTGTDKGTSLLHKGVDMLHLRIAAFCEAMGAIEFAFSVPLDYGRVPRPLSISSRFGPRPLRTFVTYTSDVRVKVDLPPPAVRRAANTPGRGAATNMDARAAATNAAPPRAAPPARAADAAGGSDEPAWR
ncbi:MAG: hypothetical protein GXX96_07420 [Planctomycetaceae bacterium]|nr:hypothetical protein [Planctomycetaceae bacterium]